VRASAGEKAGGLDWLRGVKEERERETKRWVDWAAGKKGRGGKGNGFFVKLFFKFIFQSFKIHSNRKPCIRIMMHNHLLSLILFK
jgi:hypothetical protein